MPPRLSDIVSDHGDSSFQEFSACFSTSSKSFACDDATIDDPPRRRRRSKHVQFSPAAFLKPIQAIDKKLKNNLWYSRKELEQIKAESIRTILRHQKHNLYGTAPNPDDDLRGLETKVPSSDRQRQCIEVRNTAKEAVFEEQTLQRDEGSIDPDWIAELYAAETAPAAHAARIRGIQDASQVAKMNQKFGHKFLRAILNNNVKVS